MREASSKRVFFRGFRSDRTGAGCRPFASVRIAVHAAAAALALLLRASPTVAQSPWGDLTEKDVEHLTAEERRELGLARKPPPNPPPSFERMGKGLFWAGYGVDFTIAGLALLSAVNQNIRLAGPGSRTPCLDDVCDRNVLRRTRHYTPLFIPVVGPIWTLGYPEARREPFYTGVIAASLGMQLAGIPLYVDGVVNGRSTTERAWTLVPHYGQTERGIRLGHSF